LESGENASRAVFLALAAFRPFKEKETALKIGLLEF
jgi:hypothetical protein